MVCSFCGALVLLEGRSHAEDFGHTLRAWRNPQAQGFHGAIELEETSWITGQQLGASATSQVLMGQLARFPTGFGVVRVLRPGAGPLARAARAWDALTAVWSAGRTNEMGAMATRLPIPLARGLARGSHEVAGRQVVVTGWRPGFRLALREVKTLHGGRIPATAAVWVWRRLLETLESLHRMGLGHGAVLPQHALIEDGEHGVSLVGFGSAGALSGRHDACPEPDTEHFASAEVRGEGRLSTVLDLQMAARTVIDALGGDAATASVPSEVPGPLGALLREVAIAAPGEPARLSAMALHRRVGEVPR